MRRFQAHVKRRGGAIPAAMEQARREERLKFGETVYLLEPNVKRSPGGLRDIQLLRWAGMVRHGTPDPEELCARGVLSGDDFSAISQASEFLLRLRNEMLLHGGKPSDVLDRSEQLRIAQRMGYETTAGILPVERFMRDYFRHTERVSHLVTSFVAKARSASRLRSAGTIILGHRIAGGYVVGPTEIMAGRRALKRLREDLLEVLQLVNLANLYEKRIAPQTWEAVRDARDLALRGLPRPKVLATIVRLLETTFIRVGNEEYARTNRSFGLTTMLGRHVDVSGSTIRFRFRGKSGKQHEVGITDRRLARIVRRCQEVPGQELFQYVTDDGEPPDTAGTRRPHSAGHCPCP